jgi:hypothetical protein
MLVTLKDLTLAQVRMDALDVEIELLEEALGGMSKPSPSVFRQID